MGSQLLNLVFTLALASTAFALAPPIPEWAGHIHLQYLQISNTPGFKFQVSRFSDGAILFSSSNVLKVSAHACSFSIDSGFIHPHPCPDSWTWSITKIISAVKAGPSAAAVTSSVCNSSNSSCTQLQIFINETSDISFTMQVSALGLERVQRISINGALINPEDIVFAGGEQFSVVNMARKRLHMISCEKGVGRGMQPLTDIMNSEIPGKGGTWWTTYTHFPALLQRNGWAVVATNSDYTVFDFTESMSFGIELQASVTSLTVLLGSSFMNSVMHIAFITGLMQPLPEWVHSGAIVGIEGGQDNVMRSLDSVESAVKRYNLSVSGVWIQDWSGMRQFPDRVGLWWNWQLDPDFYPDFPAIYSRAQKLGARLLTYFNPQLINISAYNDAPKRVVNLFQSAHDLGYLVMNSSNSSWTGYNGAAMLDLHRPEVVDWTASLIASQLQLPGSPVNGFMADFGEGFPISSASSLDLQLHNNFSCAWLATVSAALSKASKERGVPDDFVAFARSGCISAAKHTRLFWAGDQLTSWDSRDGIGSGLIALITGGLFGRPVSHTDIGGYTNIFHPSNSSLTYARSKEMFLRWCEFAAFTPVFRTHPGSYPELNWQFNSDEDTLSFFSRMQGIHSCWYNLRLELLALASSSGAPIIRHMLLHYWKNQSLYDLPPEALELMQTQFLVGDSLLVVPVLTSSSTSVTTLLPPGVWIRAWSMQVVEGGTSGRVISSDPAPIGQPVVYALQGGPAEEVLHCMLNKAAPM